MSKKKDKLIEDLIDPEKDMPLPDRLKGAVESPQNPSAPKNEASENKTGTEVVEPVPWSSKVERYRR